MNMVTSGPKMTLEPGLPLSTVLRNYTQANLTRIAADEDNPSVIASPVLNIDMGELTYNPSFKDLANSEIHHILEDSMFKPQKRPRRYSRSQFYESGPKHPPFHHHMRLQIRRLVSESRRRRKKSRLQPPNGCPVNGSKMPISTIYLNSGPNHPRVTITSAEQEGNEDGGITFTVKSSSLPETEEAPVRTLTETVLPWKRENDIADCDPARPQEEFPTWVNNREYYPGYMSPTHTFLESLSERKPNEVTTIYESVEEDDDCFEDDDINKPPSIERIEQKENDTYQTAFEQRAPGIQFQQSSPVTTQERRQYFRNSSAFRRSPDRFSLNSSQSEDTSRPESSDIISIECPDIALDLENEADTKL